MHCLSETFRRWVSADIWWSLVFHKPSFVPNITDKPINPIPIYYDLESMKLYFVKYKNSLKLPEDAWDY